MKKIIFNPKGWHIEKKEGIGKYLDITVEEKSGKYYFFIKPKKELMKEIKDVLSKKKKISDVNLDLKEKKDLLRLSKYPIKLYKIVGYEEPPNEDIPIWKEVPMKKKFLNLLSGKDEFSVSLDKNTEYKLKIGFHTVTYNYHDAYKIGISGRTHIYRYDAGTGTYSSDLFGSSGWDFFTDDAEAGDMIYFGNWYHPGQFEELQFHIDTPRNGDVTCVWEYYSEDGTWKTIPNVVDETNCFSKTGTRRVYFDMDDIPDWYYTQVAGSQTQCWFIRCRLTSVTGLTEGGHQQSGHYLEFPNRYIVAIGGSESNPITLSDIYNEDLSQSVTLLDETISSDPETFDLHSMIRPPKSPTRLHITCTARSGATATITGLDENGNTISETIDISSGDVWTDHAFTWVNDDGITVTGLSSGDSFKIEQPRLGIIEFRDPNLYIIHGGITIGDGTTSSYFEERQKQIYASRHILFQVPVIQPMQNAIVQMGIVVSESDKSSQYGCDLHYNYYYPVFKANYIYSSTITQGKYRTPKGSYYTKGNFRIFPMQRVWNTIFKDGAFLTYSTLGDSSQSDLYNVFQFLRNLDNTNSGHMENIYLFHAPRVLYLWRDDYVANFTNIWARVTTRAGYMGTTSPITKDSYWDNCDIEKTDGTNGWLFYWVKSGSTGKIYRRYDFNVKVVDESGSPVQNANVTLYDTDGNVVFSLMTDSNGDIETQKVVYAIYESNNGATGYGLEIKKSPHRLVIKKEGYELNEIKGLEIDQKTTLQVQIKKARITPDQEVME